MHIEGRAIEMTVDEAIELATQLMVAVQHANKTGNAWFANGVTAEVDGKACASRITFRIEKTQGVSA